MKKLLTILLIAAMAASMTACTKHTTPTASSEITSSSVSAVSSSSDSSSISSSSAVSSPSTATSNTASKVDSAATSSKSSGSKVSTTVSTQKNTTGGHSSAQTPASTTRGGSGSPNSTTTTTKPSNNSTAPTTPTSSYKLVMPTQSQLNDLSNRVLSLINAERARCGASALRVEPKLTQAAQIRATETCRNYPSYNGHMRPDGTLYATVLSDVQYGTRMESQASKDGVHWYTQVDYNAGQGAENLTSAWYDPEAFPNGFRCTSSELNQAATKIFNDWKSSSGHYRNMVSSTFTATGVGCKAIIIKDFMSIQCIQIFTEK